VEHGLPLVANVLAADQEFAHVLLEPGDCHVHKSWSLTLILSKMNIIHTPISSFVENNFNIIFALVPRSIGIVRLRTKNHRVIFFLHLSQLFISYPCLEPG
jgi:hypothetical protein